MNLENYFAKYLSRSSQSSGGQSQGQPNGGHQPPFKVVFPPPPPPPPRPESSNRDGEENRSSNGRPESSDGGGEGSVKDSPGAAGGEGLKRVVKPVKVTVVTEDGAEEEDLLLLPGRLSKGSDSASPPFLVNADTAAKRRRESAGDEEVTPVVERRRLRRCTGAEDDDDDELDVLLGKEEADKMKRFEAILAEGGEGNAGKASASLRKSTDCTAIPIGALAWSTSSNRVRESFATYFSRQFEYELRQSEELFDSFEPFFKDKQLRRIIEDDDLHQVFLGPSHPVTADGVGALPDCVLRDYQVHGVQFLLEHFHRGVSCILSDDMGLGKTAQICAFLQVLRRMNKVEGPHLIVAPLSTLTSWTRELARWAPQLQVLKYHGERKAREHARRSRHYRHAVVVTTPAVLTQEKAFFRKRAWVVVIVDEAHVLKGRDTNVTHTSRKLHACFRVAVTGTPVHNNVKEVWSLMSFLYPSLTAGYGGDGGDDDSLQAAADCARLLRHIMLRRTKESTELGIPPRIDEPVILLEPTYIQSQVLSQLTARVLQEAEETQKANAGSGRQFQAHLSRQRAVCNHPMSLRLLATEERNASSVALHDRLRAAGVSIDERTLVATSAKMVYLDQMLPRLKAERHRCLLFSNFTTTLDLLEAFCELRQYSYERLDGSCNRVERELSMLRFNAPTSTCFLFLVTTTAGGVGVTLTGADTVILFDAHFNPQLDRQAADRAHRIGQTRPVHVYRLCLANTVEEHIREIADTKASLGDFIVEGGTGHHSRKGNGDDGSTRLTAEDIRSLMERLASSRSHAPLSSGTAILSPTSTDALARQEGFVASLSQRAEEDAVVADLVRVERGGLPEGRGGGGGASSGGGPGAVAVTHNCFVCGGIMHPMEPLYHCQVCPKAFHADCLGLKRPKVGENVSRHWSCPRHACSTCGKAQAMDGAIFMCVSCPRSFCFDCLDPRYLALDAAGTELLHIKKTYPEAEAEGVTEKRTSYYLSCLRCCGVLPSSSSSSSSGGGSDGDEAEEIEEAEDEDEKEEEEDHDE